MRIKEPFAADRTSEIIEYKKKFFIASEGSTTEPKYFERLNQTTIKENITIINILRDYVNQGCSNPSHVIKLLAAFLANSGKEITIHEIKNKIKNWCHENPNKVNLENILLKIDKKYSLDSIKISREKLDELFMELFKSEIYNDLAQNFSSYFQAQDVTYSPEVDSLNMVIDRDKDSFTIEQYDQVVEFCNENKINLYVSNPNFELWLLMHFDEFEKENYNELFENKVINNSGKRYLEKRLNEICKYKKNNIKFSYLEPGIKKAITREKLFAEDTISLKNNLGTNVGLLVGQIIDDK